MATHRLSGHRIGADTAGKKRGRLGADRAETGNRECVVVSCSSSPLSVASPGCWSQPASRSAPSMPAPISPMYRAYPSRSAPSCCSATKSSRARGGGRSSGRPACASASRTRSAPAWRARRSPSCRRMISSPRGSSRSTARAAIGRRCARPPPRSIARWIADAIALSIVVTVGVTYYTPSPPTRSSRSRSLSASRCSSARRRPARWIVRQLSRWSRTRKLVRSEADFHRAARRVMRPRPLAAGVCYSTCCTFLSA